LALSSPPLPLRRPFSPPPSTLLPSALLLSASTQRLRIETALLFLLRRLSYLFLLLSQVRRSLRRILFLVRLLNVFRGSIG
jgi:hypothetical protein